MLKPLNSIGRIAITVFGLASYTLAQGSSIPETSYEIDRGDLFDGALYISNFECLVFGENWFKQQACLYYKALVSDLQTPGKTSKEICFKEFMTVSKPRDFKSETNLRIKYETTPIENDFNGYIAGATSFARIISNEPASPSDRWDETTSDRWHETTSVALYDCDVPLNETAQKTESEPETPTATEQALWKNPPLAADQSLPHGLRLLPGHSVIGTPEQTEVQGSKTNFVVKVPNTSAHNMWWSEQYAEQLERLGWRVLGSPPPLKMLNRQDEQCKEQMILISLDPNSVKSPMLKGSNLPEIEFSALAFNYTSSGTCKTDE